MVGTHHWKVGSVTNLFATAYSDASRRLDSVKSLRETHDVESSFHLTQRNQPLVVLRWIERPLRVIISSSFDIALPSSPTPQLVTRH